MTIRVADLAGPSPSTGEQPQAANLEEMDKKDYTMLSPDEANKDPDEYNFVMSATHVIVSPENHNGMFEDLGLNNFNEPHAYGKLLLKSRWDALWQLHYTNISLTLVEKNLRKYTKENGWNYDGLVSPDGTFYDTPNMKQARLSSVPGIGEINPGVKDWKNKEWAGLETFDSPGYRQSEKPFYGLEDYDKDMPMTKPTTCEECGENFLNRQDLEDHLLKNHINPERKPGLEPMPVVDMDAILPAGFNEAIMDKTVQRQSGMIAKLAQGVKQPTIAGPIPFIYDIQQDRVYVGHPGERHADIKGRFTPGGIVEGLYDPKGHVQIKTDTDMPYTVRHLIELWYYLHSELEIKSVFLMSGNDKIKLADVNIANKVRNLVACNAAAWEAYQSLSKVGNVYAVGGVVRDVILGNVPKDIDLLVQGVEENEIMEILGSNGNRVDLTGRDFGVFRFKSQGDSVEISLPRSERSTGEGHKSFEVTANAYLSVGEDLSRRDFTANAIAVNLNTRELVDPYHGSEDLKSNVLHRISEASFQDDPLRILRGLALVSRYNLDLTQETENDIISNVEKLSHLSPERIQMELDKMMAGEFPAKAVEVAEKTGVMAQLLPEYQATVGFDQKSKYHQKLLNDHIKDVLARIATLTDNKDLRLAALLHDLGKPASQWFDDEGYGHYYEKRTGNIVKGKDHAKVGARMARDIMTRLRYPQDRIDYVEKIILHHMFSKFETQKGARKFIATVGDLAEDLLLFHDADKGVKENTWDGNIGQMRQFVANVRDGNEPTERAHLAITGNDLIEIGFPRTQVIGSTLKFLTDMVVENPERNTKEELLRVASKTLDSPVVYKLDGKINAEEYSGWQTTSTFEFTSNILDDIHSALDVTVFNNAGSEDPELKPKLGEWLRKKIYKILLNEGWPNPEKYLRLVLTGSLCTYQYSSSSDFDVSLWIQTENLHEWVRADVIALMIEKAEGIIVPGTTHPLQAFVVDTRKYKSFSDLYQPGIRSAWDIDQKRWIIPPDKAMSKDVTKAYPAEMRYAHDIVDRVKMLLRYDKPALKVYWDYLHKRRFLDMQAGRGNYAESNIQYKALEQAGLFPLIAEAVEEHVA